MKKITFFLNVLITLIGLNSITISAFDTIGKKVCANVGSAIINVTYCDYGDIPVNAAANGSIEIRNLGNVDLLITGYTGPRQPSIFIPDLHIEPNNPLRVTPGQVLTYEVRFLPRDTIEYTDSMFFISNSEKFSFVDSVVDLRGRGIKPDLIANGYDWGRRRIYRSNFPAGPYDPDSGYQVIKLYNGGTMAVTIYNIKIISNINGNAFEFDRGQLTNIQIQAHDSIIVPVKFHPTTPCLNELIFSYDNTAESTTQTVLRGNGTVPQLVTENYDFGTTKLMDTSNPSNRLIRITNKSSADWPCGDSVTIFNLISLQNGNEISTDLVTWGTEGFRYDKSSLSFPIKLAQGEYLEFPAQFVAGKDSQSLAYLKSVSDAEEEVTSKWSGMGIIDDVIEYSNNKNEIEISPNPADDFLSINLQDMACKPDFVRLFDYYGNVVFENKNIIENNFKIKTSELASGMYMLQIGSGGGVMTSRKIVVVH